MVLRRRVSRKLPSLSDATRKDSDSNSRNFRGDGVRVGDFGNLWKFRVGNSKMGSETLGEQHHPCPSSLVWAHSMG